MISNTDFIKKSLALHLFFARIMKEHSFFLMAGFTQKNSNLIQQADAFRMAFDDLLADAVALSNGVVNQEVLASGEVITPYTLNAEMLTTFYTGVQLQTDITKAEAGLAGNGIVSDPQLEQRVHYLNDQAIKLVSGLIQFKVGILTDVLACKLFTTNYPLLIDHILREAKLYLATIQKLQKREDFNLEQEAYEQEAFWNRIMAEHSKFIRGLLDPTENDLFVAAHNFGVEFDALTMEARQAIDRTIPLDKVTQDSLNATQRIKEFNTAGTQGLLNCKIKSIIIPLLGDHVLRESNHYLRLLKTFQRL
jgi:hypothetical protein